MVSISSLPASILERSRMSLMIESKPAALRAIVSQYSVCSASSLVAESRCVMPMMPFIGVRISWLMVARNVLFVAFAVSAFSFAAMSDLSRSRSLSTSSVVILSRRWVSSNRRALSSATLAALTMVVKSVMSDSTKAFSRSRFCSEITPRHLPSKIRGTKRQDFGGSPWRTGGFPYFSRAASMLPERSRGWLVSITCLR